MAAPMVANNLLSKKTFRYTILGNILISTVLLCLAYIPLNGSSQLDVISSPFTATKILASSTLILHLILHFMLSNRAEKLRLGVWIKNTLRSLAVFASSVFVFHGVAVLFGAAFTYETAETFHFAMMLSSATIGPLLVHTEGSVDIWSRVLHSPELGVETSVYVSSITSMIGAWLGAFPIPLDWDRPWQVWPITCVLGTLTGHCIGLLLSSIYISLQFYKVNKFKLT